MLLLPSLLTSLLPLALAQGYGAPASNPTTTAAGTKPSSSSSPVAGVQVVTVGSSGLSFSPNSITAAVGSQVEFHFFPPTHSVGQSSFASPCAPPTNGSGFWSGLIQSSGGQNANVFRITVNDTSPIWFYCAVPTHCQSGMVGVINPPNDPNETLDKFMSAAAQASTSVEPPTVQGGVTGAAASSTGSAPASTTSKASSATSIWDSIVRISVLTGVLAGVAGWMMS